MSPSSLLSILALSATLWSPDGAAAARDAMAQAASAAPQEDVRLAEMRVLLEQSRRASFNAHSAELALEALADGADPSGRPKALFALGASGERAMSPRLESWAVEGSAIDRRAAILGLAEGGFATLDLLTRLARSNVAEVREAALLALARMPNENARAALARLQESDATDREAAARAQAFAADPLTEPAWTTGRAWLELRWDGARRFGLIDGQPWRAHLLGGLCADATFLDALVYGAASDLHRAGTADHFLEIALASGPPARLRSVVAAIPAQLDRMIQSGVWFPASQEEWAELLYAIDERRLESSTVELLRQARAFPDLSAFASVLLVRAGNFEGLSMLELDIASPDPVKRQRIAETLGGTHETRYIDLLETLRGDEDPRVRMSAAIAQMRLGNSLSVETVRGTLAGEDGPERAALVDGLCRVASEPDLAALLSEYASGFSPEERLASAIALAREGDPRNSAVLRAAVEEKTLRSPRGEALVQALVRINANADIAALFDLFPLEDARAIDVQIAQAMCARRDPTVMPMLRAALWQAPFDRSILAAALIEHVGGLDALRIELDRPPKGARDQDVRRVGYALGEWGGPVEVERLGRRRTSADPALQGAYLGALGARTH